MDELSLIELGQILLRRKWLVLSCSILLALIASLVSFYLITPSYQATTSLYVNNGSQSSADAVTSKSDIDASQALVATYIQILNSETSLNAVINKLNLVISTEDLRDMISMSALNNTEVLQINVVSGDPDEAVQIANTLLGVAPDILTRVVQTASVEKIDSAAAAEQVGPDIVRNTVLGFLLGLILSSLFVIVAAVMDKRVNGEEDITRHQLPLLAVIPDYVSIAKKGGYYYEKK